MRRASNATYLTKYVPSAFTPAMRPVPPGLLMPGQVRETTCTVSPFANVAAAAVVGVAGVGGEAGLSAGAAAATAGVLATFAAAPQGTGDARGRGGGGGSIERDTARCCHSTAFEGTDWLQMAAELGSMRESNRGAPSRAAGT